MEHPNVLLLNRFYDAFARRDAEEMVACYHSEVHFKDPVFDLRGGRAKAMWRMLCARGKDLHIESSEIRAYDETGVAHWDAAYTFTQTGRRVHNSVDAEFAFKDGLIRSHRDTFDLWRWTRHALGAPGWLLGWTPWMQHKVSAQATQTLDDYIAKHPEALD